jgi:predicted Fe-Mo cluster-binding NifX family protein
MKIAIPIAEGKMSAHFGHAEQFAIIEADLASKQILKIAYMIPPPHEPGALPRWLQKEGVNTIIAGGMGQRAKTLLAESGIAIRSGGSGGAPEDLVKAFLGNQLTDEVGSCHHHDCNHTETSAK